MNTRVIENFISSRFRCKTRLKSKQITSYQTLNINDDLLSEVINRCVAISVRVETKKTFVEFDETHIDEMNIILDMSWLRENRSQMNWERVTLKWDKIKKTSIKAVSKKVLKSMIRKLSQIGGRTWSSPVHTSYSNRVVDCCWLDRCSSCKLLNISIHCLFWLSMTLSLIIHEYLSSRAIHNKVLFFFLRDLSCIYNS